MAAVFSYCYLRQGDAVSAGVCLFVSLFVLFVCQQLYAKSYERISMKFSGSVGDSTRKNLIDLGSYWQNADLRQRSRAK